MICRSAKKRHEIAGSPILTLYGHSVLGKLAHRRRIGCSTARRPVCSRRAGLRFYAGNDKVGLADTVPWRFIAVEN